MQKIRQATFVRPSSFSVEKNKEKKIMANANKAFCVIRKRNKFLPRRARDLVVSDLCSETKGSRLKRVEMVVRS